MGKYDNRAVRFGARKPSELQAAAARLREAADSLHGIATDMQANGIKQVSFDGVTKVDRATEEVNEYNDTVEIAVRKLKRTKA